ncbi:hypothetical protein Adt_45586 [Abeliophyllum distichum]|uniref:Uncharacterized protein n=1 Tax=Abeliophyllum distichum TaxID=126358 RepID=A0ABD1PE36_9LAMI
MSWLEPQYRSCYLWRYNPHLIIIGQPQSFLRGLDPEDTTQVFQELHRPNLSSSRCLMIDLQVNLSYGLEHNFNLTIGPRAFRDHILFSNLKHISSNVTLSPTYSLGPRYLTSMDTATNKVTWEETSTSYIGRTFGPSLIISLKL